MSLAAASAGIAQGAAELLVHGLALAGCAHLAARLGLWRRRPAVWAALWTVVLVKWISPWGPSIAGSLADVGAMLWPSAELSSAGPLRVAPSSPHDPSGGPASALWILLVLAWVTVAGLRLLGGVLAVRRQRRAALELPAAPAWLLERVGEMARRLGLGPRSSPAVRVHPQAVIPHLLAGGRPLLVVPKTLLEELALLDLALAHELAHLRRRDWIARWLHAAVAAVWFFLPIRILIGRSLERAQEAAADALAARALSLSPPVYARRLVDATLRCQGQAGRPLVGVLALAAPAALVERIEALCLRRSLATTGLGGAAFVVAFGVLGLGQPRAAAPAQAVAQCDYSPAIAEALREVHPEADLDGDGELARDEACALQEQLRRVARDGVEPGAEQASAEPLWQRLCCNCEVSGTSEGRDARDLYEERSEPLADPGGPGACEQE